METKPSNKFNIEQSAAAVRESLERLRTTQKPGIKSGGTGTKMDVLQAAKDDIIKLLADGYTAQQIAEAIKSGNAGFGILPKSITMLAGKPSTPKAPRRKRSNVSTTEQHKEPASKSASPSTNNAPTNKGGFPIDSDEV